MSSHHPVRLIHQGIEAYHADNLVEARARFAEALVNDPDYELSWIWFATVTKDHQEQRYCLNRALAINPESPARQRLDAVRNCSPMVPPELLSVDRPPLPADLEAGPEPLIPVSRVTRRRPLAVDHDPSEPESHSFRQKLNFRWYNWVVLALLPVVAAVAIVIGLLTTEPVPFLIAIVSPISGPEAALGQEQVNSAQLAVDEINDRGGINGNPVDLLVLDDGNDPERALLHAQDLSQNDHVLYVIGHYDSDATNAASAVYEEAGIPAINASETTEVITGTNDNDLYFSVVIPSQNQGNFMAGYTLDALDIQSASIVTGSNEYSAVLSDAFAETFTTGGGTITNRWNIDTTDLQSSINTIVDDLAAADDPGLVILALQPHEARDLIIQAKRYGIDVTWFGAPSLGYDAFPAVFADEIEEKTTTGYFTNGMLAASPLIYDSIGGPAMEFSGRYRNRFDNSPDWFGARVYDSVTVGATAIDRAELDPTSDITELRSEFLTALRQIASSESGANGLSSPVFFNPEGYVPRSLSIGHFSGGDLRSEPIQYRLVSDPNLYQNLAADDVSNLIMTLPDGVFRQYQIVYTGIDIIEVSSLDTTAQTFTADFFIWMLYNNGIAAANITFANVIDPTVTLGTPIEQNIGEETTYEMYRVQGVFSQPMDFHDYPWDEHTLRIAFGNTMLSDDDIIYVADSSTLERTQEQRLLSGTDQSRLFNTVPSWKASSVWYSQEPQISRTVSQDPVTGVPGYASHSEFQIDIDYDRTITSFLIKDLLPLGLLSLVVYITLFFPTDQTNVRTGFAITSILTCSVLLQGISGRLPAIGYTVAIEWSFFIFIGISAGIILLGIVIDHFVKAKRPAVVRRIEVGSRVVYPFLVAGLAAVYYVRFAIG